MIEISSSFLFFLSISRSCPAHLEAGLTRAVLDEARVNYLSQNTASMSPTGTAIDASDGKKNEKFASTDDLQSAQPSLSSTKGSQGKIPIAVFVHLQQSFHYCYITLIDDSLSITYSISIDEAPSKCDINGSPGVSKT